MTDEIRGYSRQDDDPEDLEPVLEVDSAFLDALETLKVEKIMRFWSDSEDITLVYPGTEVACGKKSILDVWTSVSRGTSHLKIFLKPVNMMRFGDMAWIFRTGMIQSTHGYETLTVEIFSTNVYRREEATWKLVHLHASPSPHQPPYFDQILN